MISLNSRISLELTLKLDDTIVDTKWVSLQSPVNTGDSHLYPLMFPLPSPGPKYYLWTKKNSRKLHKLGYSVKNLSGYSSLGVPLFKKKRNGKVELRLLKGMNATIGDKSYHNEENSPLDINVAIPSKGVVNGLKGWSIEFDLSKQTAFKLKSAKIPSLFFTQSLIYGFVFLIGILWIGFLKQREEPIVKSDIMVKRIASYNSTNAKIKKEKSKPEVVVTKPKKKILRAAISTRRIRFKTRKQKPVKKIKMSAFFKKRRGWVKKNEPEQTTDNTDKSDSSDSSGTQSSGLPPGDAIELPSSNTTINIQPVVPVVAPPPMKPKPFIKIKPKRLKFPSIVYPESAKHLGIEGKVKIRIYIDKSGKVYKVDVIKKLHPILDRVAIKAAKRAKYKPALDQYGSPINSTSVISITFKLEEDE